MAACKFKPYIYLPSHEECDLVSDDPQFIDKFEEYNFSSQRAMKVSRPEKADIILIFEAWSFKRQDYAQKLSDSPLLKNHASKTYVINYDDTVGEGFLPGCYTSLKLSSYNDKRFIPITYPKIYNESVDLSKNYAGSSKYLFSFRGTTDSHPIRKKVIDQLSSHPLANIVEINKQFHSHSEGDKLAFVEQTLSSLFVLCPRGWSPNTYRIYETMNMGRCPVIISDEWVETSGPNWARCSVRVAESDIENIPNILNNLAQKGEKMGQQAYEEWQKHFDEKAKYHAYLDHIIDLHFSAKTPTMLLPEYIQYWRSDSFLFRNNWTIRQKVARKLRSLLQT